MSSTVDSGRGPQVERNAALKKSMIQSVAGSINSMRSCCYSILNPGDEHLLSDVDPNHWQMLHIPVRNDLHQRIDVLQLFRVPLRISDDVVEVSTTPMPQGGQKTRALKMIAAYVSHRYNNLSMALLGHLSLMQGQVPSGSQVQDLILGMEQSIHSFASVIGQLMEYLSEDNPKERRIRFRWFILEILGKLGDDQLAEVKKAREGFEKWVRKVSLSQVVAHVISCLLGIIDGYLRSLRNQLGFMRCIAENDGESAERIVKMVLLLEQADTVRYSLACIQKRIDRSGTIPAQQSILSSKYIKTLCR